ncbi:MAG: 30S ribosomal protein S13 [Candidatus Omnitrophota bacterium]
MPRILGVDIPKEKRIDIALTYLYGIGRHVSRIILKDAGIDPAKRAKDLNEEEVSYVTNAIQKSGYKVEGDLRREISQNIKRLMDIGSWRGMRHKKGLPVRGQRTRTNARTRKGPRKGGMTVIKKPTADKKAAPAAKKGG